jgi:hypothetical protein
MQEEGVDMQHPDEAKVKALKGFLETIDEPELKALLEGFCSTLDPRRLRLDYERLLEKKQ